MLTRNPHLTLWACTAFILVAVQPAEQDCSGSRAVPRAVGLLPPGLGAGELVHPIAGGFLGHRRRRA